MSYLILEDKVNSSVIWQILNTIGTKYSRVDQVKICGRQPLKKLKGYGLLKLTIFFKGCLPQILLGPILNTLSQMKTGYKSLTRVIYSSSAFFETRILTLFSQNFVCIILITVSNRNFPISIYAKIFERLTFLTVWYAHVRMRITANVLYET